MTNHEYVELLRKQVRDAHVSSGVPFHEAQEIADLAIHAVDMAARAMADVCDNASTPGVVTCALATAVQLAAARFSESFERIAQVAETAGIEKRQYAVGAPLQ